MRHFRKKILIVDDDDATVLALLRDIYQHSDRCDVLVARRGVVAQQIMRENTVAVLLTALSLPGMHGFDLIAWTAVESPNTCMIAAIDNDAQQERQRARAFAMGCLYAINKPLNATAVRRLVMGIIDSRDCGVCGSFDAISPADVIQMLCLGRKTIALRVIDGNSVGIIHIKQGQIVHAEAPDIKGERALYSVLRMTGGKFDTLPIPHGAQETVSGGWQQLLMEGVRRQDELAAAKTGLYPLLAEQLQKEASDVAAEQSATEYATPQPLPTNHDIAELIDAGFDAMRRGDLNTAREKWTTAQKLDPENRTLESNLRRLNQLDTEN